MIYTLSHCLAISVLLTTFANPPGDLFVDINAPGCATGTGSLADPICSIDSAIGLASPGDTIHIAPGTYVENLVIGFDLELFGRDGDSVTIVSGVPLATESVITVQPGALLTIDGLTIRDGNPLGDGGGVRVDGDLVLRNSTVRDNRNRGFSQLGGYPCGGGISAVLPGSTIVIEESLICDNYSFGDGGGIGVRGANLTIRNSSIVRNEAYLLCYGGGIFAGAVFGSVPTQLSLTNSTIGQNVSGSGDAIYLAAKPGSILDSLSVEGQVWHQGGVGNLSVRNSILARGLQLQSYYSALYGDFTSLGNNLVGEPGPGSTGFTNGVNGDLVGTAGAPLDPLFGVLANHGGRTETFALLPGSPAIDNGGAVTFQPFDQRGVARPQGSTSDIGAFEFGGAFSNYCSGDGGDQMACTDCPCGNNSGAGSVGGCLNAVGTAARLGAAGSASVTLPPSTSTDLRFDLVGAPPTVLCVLTSGDALAPASAGNPCFPMGSGVQSASFDGLRCAILNTRRHGSRQSDASGEVGDTNAPWGGEGGPGVGIAVAFGGFTSGQTRFFQAIYRDDPAAVCMRGLNTTQAIEILFTP